MDKDFDKLHEFVEIMKVRFHCMPSVGHMGNDGGDARPGGICNPLDRLGSEETGCLLIRGLEVGVMRVGVRREVLRESGSREASRSITLEA